MAKVKQPRLPGMVEEKIAELEDAAEEYVGFRDERQKIGQKEIECKARLLELMKAKKLKHYEYDGKTIEVVHEQETVKVSKKRGRKAKKGSNGDAEGSE